MAISTYEYLFWLSILIIFYIYMGYPILVAGLAKLIGIKTASGEYYPKVSILIAAYNESSHIGATIQNKLDQSYPQDKLQIIVISDCSEDGTDEIVSKYSASTNGQVKLLRQVPRNGKTSALNMAIEHAEGEILVFSDANSIYANDALRILVQKFVDQSVGYVSGKMIYVNSDKRAIGDGCSAYMRYENMLRKYETCIGSIVGVDGGIDAIRKKLYQPMRADQLPDFVLPLKVIEQGYRVIYEPGAVLKEDTLSSSADEYRMRVRVSLRALWALWDMKYLFDPLRYRLFSWQLFSHKLLRYFAFIFLITAFATNMALIGDRVVYNLSISLQITFYLAAFVGWYLEKKEIDSRIFYVPYYFSLINLAACHAFYKFINRQKQVIWNPRVG